MTVSGRRRKRARLIMLAVLEMCVAVVLGLVAVLSSDLSIADRWRVAVVVGVSVLVGVVVVWACLDMLDDGP